MRHNRYVEFGAILLGAGVIAAVMTGVFISVRRPVRPVSSPSAPVVSSERYTPELSDISVPDSLTGQETPTWYPLRQKVQRWTKEMAEPYWIPVEDILVEHLKHEKNEKIEGLFNQIP